MSHTLRCRHCRADLLLGTRFCIACGISAASRCPACGEECPVAAIHCPRCSAAMEAREPTQAERRQVTVMFCDLAGSTELSVRLDPEETREIILAYQRVCSAAIGAYDGFIGRFFGDGILVYFGYPNACEDAAERAVRVGLDVVRAVAQLGDTFGMSLHARVGIATGLVIVGDTIGWGSALEHAAVGETPNLAARLQAIAEPDTVVIAESTRRLVGSVFKISDLGRRSLKGFDKPMGIWLVHGLMAPRDRFETRHSRPRALIGRGGESARLLALQQRAWGGRGQVVLIAGEAGIGKSHLASWIAEQVSLKPYTHLRYQCSPYHRASALHPFIAQLTHSAAIKPGDDPAQRLDRLEALLARTGIGEPATAPLLAALLSIPSGQRYAPLGMSSEQQRQLTMTALLDQLSALAARQPVLATFEDLQWADPTSLELLDAALARTVGARVLAILTFRPGFDASRWAAAESVTRIDLGRLGPEDARAMVASVAAPRSLPDRLIDRIAERSDGVPLYVEELTRTVSRARPRAQQRRSIVGAATDPSLLIPDSLRDALVERLDRLATVKEAAQTAAAIGRVFPFGLLRAAYEGTEAELETALAQLEEAGIIEVESAVDERVYRFKHALLQEAAYDILLKRRRRIIHQRIAEALQGEFRAMADKEPEVIAHHFTYAGLPDEAIAWWKTAGEWAINRSAYAEAALNLGKAIALADGLAASVEQRRLQLKLQVAYGQVMIASRGYAAPEAVAAFKKARQLAGAIEDAAERYSVYHGLWASSHIRGDLTLMREISQAFLQEVAGREGLAEAGIARRLVGTTCVFAGQFIEAKAHLESALAAYEPVRDRPLALRFGHDIGVAAECYLALALWPLGEIGRACHLAGTALAHADASAHPPTMAYGHAYRCIFEAMRRNAPEAAHSAETLVALSREHAMHWWLSSGIFFRGWTLWHRGDRDEGEVDMRRGMELCRQHGLAAPPALFEVLMADVEEKSGQFDAALARLDLVVKHIRRSGECWLEAEVHRYRSNLLRQVHPDDPAAAEAALRHALDVARAQGTKTFELRAMLDLARLHGAKGWDDGMRSELLRACSALGAEPGLVELEEAAGLLAGGSRPGARHFEIVARGG